MKFSGIAVSILLLASGLMLSAVSCVKNPEYDIEGSLTPAISDIKAQYSTNEIGITLSAKVSNMMVVKSSGFRWGESAKDLDNDIEAIAEGQIITARIETKDFGKKLYYKPYVTNGRDEITGKTAYVTVPKFDYYVTLSEPSITLTTDGDVRVSSEINVAKGITITEKGIRYGDSENTLASVIKCGSGSGPVTEVPIPGLEIGKTYYVCAYSKEDNAEVVSKIVLVSPYTLPSVEITEIKDITSSSSMVIGEVTDDSGSTVTDRGVVWSTLQNPTVDLKTKKSCGPGKGSFSAELTGLDPYTKYYVRAYATNKAGTVYGTEVSFTTLVQNVTGVTLDKNTLALPVGESATLVATVLPSNAANKSVTWGSDNSAVASVSQSGVVSAMALGNTTIRVTTEDGSYTSECQVSVVDKYSDLSKKETANCYIVSKAGDYKFNCTVKGNSSESVGTPSSAEVLWESYGTSTTPSVGSIITDVKYEDGYVKFSTPSTLKNGNAVIAVKNSSGTILWSWHIWVCKDFDPESTAQEYNNNAGTMMDRNLGATSATKGDVQALGLLFQWGRKDPFLGSCKICYSSDESQQEAGSTISWPSSVSSTSSNGTISYTVAHPTTFITYNSSNDDWYYSSSSSTDNTRWRIIKTVYDPCPAGWRVPDGSGYGVWSKALGTISSWTTSSNWDSTNKGMNFGSTDRKLGSGTIWYPAAGYRSSIDGSLYEVGNSGIYWSFSPAGPTAYGLYFVYDGSVSPSLSYGRACGQSVRCLSE